MEATLPQARRPRHHLFGVSGGTGFMNEISLQPARNKRWQLPKTEYQVSREILIDGNLAEKSLALAAMRIATWRAMPL